MIISLHKNNSLNIRKSIYKITKKFSLLNNRNKLNKNVTQRVIEVTESFQNIWQKKLVSSNFDNALTGLATNSFCNL